MNDLLLYDYDQEDIALLSDALNSTWGVFFSEEGQSWRGLEVLPPDAALMIITNNANMEKAYLLGSSQIAVKEIQAITRIRREIDLWS